MRTAFFPYGDAELEAFGVRLITQVSAVLRAEIDSDLPFIPIGPDFLYDASPELFLSRRGCGPLRVVWDTNLLIDYFDYGHLLWEVGLPDDLPDYADELEALQFVIALWVIRDIHFHILPRVLVDGRLSEQRLAARSHAIEQFAAVLRLTDSDDGVEPRSRNRARFKGDLERTLDRVPASDRALVRDAVNLGAHVFLTRDKRVLACKRELLPFGILIASPGDLFVELIACGAFHCLVGPRYAYWPLPDQARVSHLVNVMRRTHSSGGAA